MTAGGAIPRCLRAAERTNWTSRSWLEVALEVRQALRAGEQVFLDRRGLRLGDIAAVEGLELFRRRVHASREIHGPRLLDAISTVADWQGTLPLRIKSPAATVLFRRSNVKTTTAASPIVESTTVPGSGTEAVVTIAASGAGIRKAILRRAPRNA